jgi:hypothetical protein
VASRRRQPDPRAPELPTGRLAERLDRSYVAVIESENVRLTGRVRRLERTIDRIREALAAAEAENASLRRGG